MAEAVGAKGESVTGHVVPVSVVRRAYVRVGVDDGRSGASQDAEGGARVLEGAPVRFAPCVARAV